MRVRGFEVVKDKFRKNKDTNILLPKRATSNSSGYDFYSPVRLVVPPHSSEFVFSDVKAYMQEDEELLIFPRSGLGIKGIVIRNLIGKVDSDYYENENNDGNIGISIWNTTDNPFVIEVGDRVCQGSFYKYLTVDNDEPITDKRIGGLGHTGIK